MCKVPLAIGRSAVHSSLIAVPAVPHPDLGAPNRPNIRRGTLTGAQEFTHAGCILGVFGYHAVQRVFDGYMVEPSTGRAK